jgi:hypothetical protein
MLKYTCFHIKKFQTTSKHRRSSMKQTNPRILSTFESVSFPGFAGVGKVKAKIDTGAYTGAIHCTKIHEVDTPEGKLLHFSPFDLPDTEIILTKFAVRHVRSSNGGDQSRYFIDTTIKIQGETYPIVLSLADRSDMKWPVLIGRRFLRRNNFLVDVNKVS